MVTIGPISPEDRKIRDTFLRYLSELMLRYEEQTEASRHGDADPEFAERLDGFNQDLAQADPQYVAALLQAVGDAVIATVREFQGRKAR